MIQKSLVNLSTLRMFQGRLIELIPHPSWQHEIFFLGKKLNWGENNIGRLWYQWQKEMNGSERFPIGLIIGKPHCTCSGQNFYASTCDLVSQLVILILKIVLGSSFRRLKLKSNSKSHKKDAFHNSKYMISVQNWSTKLISWQDIFTEWYSISGV